MMYRLFVRSMVVVSLSVFFLATQANAASTFRNVDKQREEGFFFPDNLEYQPDNLANAYEASEAFRMGFSNCSGAYISPDGYYLTANHCVIGALHLNHKYREVLAESAEVYVIPQDELIGKVYQDWLSNFTATVIAAGSGFGQFDERLAHEFEPGVLETIQDVIGTDWAILKVKDVENHACLRAATQSPQKGDYSWTIGYPAATKRNVGERTNNRKKVVSYGRVSFDAEETAFYKTLNPLNRELALDFWAVLAERGEYFISDSDGQGGNSGSPTIDVHGDLTGVLVQGLLPSQEIGYERYHTYSSGIIDLQWIRESLGEEAFNEYFTCGFF